MNVYEVDQALMAHLRGIPGLEVVEVNINVTDVHLPDDDSDVAEATDLK